METSDTSGFRVAIVHDWLTGMRGGEKLLEILCELLPTSDLYTIVSCPDLVSPLIRRRRIIPSALNRLPRVRKYYRWLLPLMPSAAANLRLRGYDLVIAISHCVAHGVTVEDGARFVCYCLTPMRYAWETAESYFHTRTLNPKYWAMRLVIPWLRTWDRRKSRNVTEYVAISRAIRQRIRRCYGRDSGLIYPAADTDYYHPVAAEKGNFYLWVGALAPYKRVDLAARTAHKLGRRLIVIGEGQDMKWLRANPSPWVKVLGRQKDEVIREHYASARALLFPGEEDFGIVPVEAQACGCPVVAYGRGGAAETVVGLDDPDGRPATGVLCAEPTLDSFAEAIARFEQHEKYFSPKDTRSNALRFSREKCREGLRDLLESQYALLRRRDTTAR